MDLSNRGSFHNLPAINHVTIFLDILPFDRPRTNSVTFPPSAFTGYIFVLVAPVPCSVFRDVDLTWRFFVQLKTLNVNFQRLTTPVFGSCGVFTHGGREHHVMVMLRWGTGRGVQEEPSLLQERQERYGLRGQAEEVCDTGPVNIMSAIVPGSFGIRRREAYPPTDTFIFSSESKD